ncbi:alpha-ribazole phosphatase [Motilimonas pumila]|uniref:Alpha-ribazole phosphatase n=1 Tax=Motilimonas pumila TaxID=2303987 RepID=A0A418YB99_9GAMM|nr:alpha-ribazole phosphatase [Motilimonas pumila]RJG40260.1 alpha-ribazole phosphatase [Motilimonas pumila]
MRCYLIRHPQPDIATGMCYGQLDLSLSQFGQLQQASLLEWGKGKGITQVYTSPLTRCTGLAQQLSALSNSSYQVIDSLKEFHFGHWEGKNWSEISRTQITAWQQELLHFCIPGGESLSQFHRRVIAAWQALAQAHQGQCIALVCHAGVIRSVVAHELNLAVTESVKLGLDYGSISKLTIEGEFKQLNYLNRTLKPPESQKY